MADIVDRRRQKNSSSAKNRKRFIDRHRDKLKDAANEVLGNAKSITDLEETEHEVRISPTEEPSYNYIPDSGKEDTVVTGSGDVNQGDRIKKPQSGQGGRGGATQGENSNDDFIFQLSAKDFLDLFFDNLSLPNMIKKQLTEASSTERQKEGYTTVGAPARLSVLQTFKFAIGRSVAMVAALEEEIEKETDEDKLEELKDKLKNVPVFHDVDLRYDYITNPPTIRFKSVMFCVMDVSGSMGEWEKMIAKSFYLLLFLFLKRSYTDVDVVFVRHTTEADEVDEHTFFYATECGGTKMSSGVELVDKIIKDRYPLHEWNIYVAQATDGDNFPEDNSTYTDIMRNHILPAVQYFAYIEMRNSDGFRAMIGQSRQSEMYKIIGELAMEFDNLDGATIHDQKDVYKVFSHLFSKEEGSNE